MKTTTNNKIVRMATLIRKALTEVRNVKSLMDIPELKRERDAIREKMSTMLRWIVPSLDYPN
jgi:hypothetical protein